MIPLEQKSLAKSPAVPMSGMLEQFSDDGSMSKKMTHTHKFSTKQLLTDAVPNLDRMGLRYHILIQLLSSMMHGPIGKCPL